MGEGPRNVGTLRFVFVLLVASPISNGLLGGDSATPHRTRRGQPLRITSTTCGLTGPWDTGGRAVRESVLASVCCVLFCFVLCLCMCLFSSFLFLVVCFCCFSRCTDVQIYIYVCMYVCVFVCLYVCMHTCMSTCEQSAVRSC